MVITELEALIGLPIWTAYESVSDAAVKAPEKRPWWKQRRVLVLAVVALVIGAPLLTLDLELFFLNLVGLGIGALLLQAVHAPASSGKEVQALTELRDSCSLTIHPNTQGPFPVRGRPFFFARKRAQIG